MIVAVDSAAATCQVHATDRRCRPVRALFALLYLDLCRQARRLVYASDDELTPAALVHETYLKLVDADLPERDPAHFLALANRVMHQILNDQLRERAALKRGGDCTKVVFAEEELAVEPGLVERLDVACALSRLASHSPRPARIFALHLFGGFQFDEIGAHMDLCSRTVSRDWHAACASLRQQLPRDNCN